MNAIEGLPFYALHFNEQGSPEAADVAALTAHLAEKKPKKLVVVSHGWRNDENDATALYTELFTNVSKRLKDLGEDDGSASIAAVFWPSMVLPEFSEPPQAVNGRAASAAGKTLDKDCVLVQIDQLIAVFGHEEELKKAKLLLDSLEDKDTAKRYFIEALRKAAPQPTDKIEDASDRFFSANPVAMFGKMRGAVFLPPPASSGRAQSVHDGAAAGILDAAGDAVGAAFRLVNYLTYYQMKERAGLIGQSLNAVLKPIRAQHPDIVIHFVGHSFGARVVTSAVSSGTNLAPCSLTLLQGAFSHNGFASASVWQEDGFFRAAFSKNRVSGPLIATYTKNDTAVGMMYPIASRLSGTNASALGGSNDSYGAIGRNGAIHLRPTEYGSAKELLSENANYSFEANKFSNLKADAFIHNHGDVRNPAVANVLAHVIRKN